jgi:phosphoglycerate dehydrogenase-like enzyme
VGIVRAGVGFDNIDLMGARAAGITVCNVPDYGTDEVADHAMALLLWCLRCPRASPVLATSLICSENRADEREPVVVVLHRSQRG